MWKGFSQDPKQISPIPPKPYGERFMKFITGITMSKEQVEMAEAQVAEAAAMAQVDGAEENNAPRGRRSSQSQTLPRSNTDNSVIQRAEEEAHKSEKSGSKKDDRPDRTLLAMRSPSAERTNGVAGTTLPVVEEVGEASSTGGRSNQTAEGAEMDEKSELPPTPPKDIGIALTKKMTPPPNRPPPPPPNQQSSSGGSPTRAPPPPPVNGMVNGVGSNHDAESTRSRPDSWKEKALPPVPRVSSPEVMNEKEKSTLAFEKSRLMDRDRETLKF